MLETLIAVLSLILGLGLGLAAACAGFVVIVMYAARRAGGIPPGDELRDHRVDVAGEGELQGAVASVASPDAQSATQRQPTPPSSSTEPKTRQKPRCALCEAVRAALRLTGAKIAAK